MAKMKKYDVIKSWSDEKKYYIEVEEQGVLSTKNAAQFAAVVDQGFIELLVDDDE